MHCIHLLHLYSAKIVCSDLQSTLNHSYKSIPQNSFVEEACQPTTFLIVAENTCVHKRGKSKDFMFSNMAVLIY